MNRVDRLVSIILLLQSRKVVRARDIAEHFDISVRTVYRDVNALCEAGVPVAAEAGVGYSLVEGYHLPPVMFTTDEASALLVGRKFIEKLADSSMVKSAESALLKIQSVLPDETRGYLATLQETTEVLLQPRQARDGFRDDAMAVIQEAIVRKRVVSMEYYSHHRDSFSTRDVEPLGLLFYARHWHLISYCRLREDFRDFRTDRIHNITLRDEQFAARKGYSLKDFMATFDEVENAIEVQVKFRNDVAGYMRERYQFGLVAEKQLKTGVVMTFVVPNVDFLLGTLLAYGSKAEVLSPQSLKDRLSQEATKIVRLYQNKKNK